MRILEYKRPSDLKEAFSLLNEHEKSAIIAGGLFLRMQKRTMPLVIDLNNLNLDNVKYFDEYYEIGSMCTLRDLELNPDLNQAIKDSVKQISGVGTRNLATIGGSVCGRYPFSDIDTALIALDAKLHFYKNGEISMRDYFEKGLKEKDILLHIKVPKIDKSSTKYFKPVYTDFSLVNVAVAGKDIAIGARPSRAVYKTNVDFTLSAKEILSDIKFSDDVRASAEYRRALAEMLLTDIIKEMEG